MEAYVSRDRREVDLGWNQPRVARRGRGAVMPLVDAQPPDHAACCFPSG